MNRHINIQRYTNINYNNNLLVDYISYQDFLSFFSKHPILTNKDYYSEFPDTPKGTVRYWKMKASKGVNKTPTSVDTTKKKIRSSQPISPKIDALRFIDDPDELLMSVAVRELNKPNPDPRWANVLITTRKENIGHSKKEGKIQSKFKSMSIKDIAKISSGKPIDTSQKPGLEESS